MSSVPQHILANQKATVDNFLAIQEAVFNGFEKLVDLNLKVARASLDEASQKTQEALSVKDVQEAVNFASGLVQPGSDKITAYGKQVYDIVSGVQSTLTKLTEEQIAQAQRQLDETIDQIAKNAPTGSEGAVALMKSSLATATSAYESAAKVARQATDAAESNFAAAANATIKAANDAAEATKTATRARRAPASEA
ncbi:TIGR01841 family phasin [Yanghanlia caeni]|uniref:Phasin family protein n=1 Tax=Yanghanlia caeni TaxID=3064283 RepID=A0ABU1DA47_9BURK|nr:phasin family protein [Alcaligenaceae bacterium LG-2]NGR09198.1 phasin family protein [bacterium SGD-2]HZH57790.1 phasin family protein [Burkholderiaceae bacterium]